MHGSPEPHPLSRTAEGIGAGVVLAAAVFGMLLGFGHRGGPMWRPVNAAAHLLIGSRADNVWAWERDVTLVGSLVVLAVSVVAGVVTALLAPSRRLLHELLSSAGVALAGYLIHLHLAARTPGGLTALLTDGELRALYTVVFIALVGGMRFAFPHHGDDLTP